MKEATGNIWDWIGKVDVIFIATNLETDDMGNAIMGAGQAGWAKKNWPGIEQTLGLSLMKEEYHPVKLHTIPKVMGRAQATELWSFPTKPRGRVLRSDEEIIENVLPRYRGKLRIGWYVPSWKQPSSLELILEGAEFIQALPHDSFIIPRFGCGMGSLEWSEVKPHLGKILDDRFTAVTF